jgi:alanine dehydrogenase
MRIGVPSEIKPCEFRVGLVPASVRDLAMAGHDVLVQSGAGARIGFSDADYAAAGARIVGSAADAWAAELVVKVKIRLPAACATVIYLPAPGARPTTN